MGKDARPVPRQRFFTVDRAAVFAGLAGAVILCWLYLVPASLDMYGGMDGAAAWMMQGEWDVRYFTLIFLMWAAMMTGMMLPSAAPAVLLYGTVVRSRPQPHRPVLRGYAFAAGYLLIWAGFSLGAALLQWQLAEAALLSPMMVAASPVLGALILIVAGLYQWSPLKRACLTHCRSPLDYLSRHWRPGIGGALRMGLGHGLYCLGCCWALMLLLFFGGVMSLLWIAGITIFVLLEKLTPFGLTGGRLTGLCLIAAGVVILISWQVGLFDGVSDLVFERQIFIDEKPPFYAFANRTKELTGAEVFALYGASPEPA